MEPIKNIISTQKKRVPVKAPTYKWQELPLKILNEFDVVDNEKSSIFKHCKDNPQKALIAYNECVELGKKNAPYFFKLMSIYMRRKTSEFKKSS